MKYRYVLSMWLISIIVAFFALQSMVILAQKNSNLNTQSSIINQPTQPMPILVSCTQPRRISALGQTAFSPDIYGDDVVYLQEETYGYNITGFYFGPDKRPFTNDDVTDISIRSFEYGTGNHRPSIFNKTVAFKQHDNINLSDQNRIMYISTGQDNLFGTPDDILTTVENYSTINYAVSDPIIRDDIISWYHRLSASWCSIRKNGRGGGCLEQDDKSTIFDNRSYYRLGGLMAYPIDENDNAVVAWSESPNPWNSTIVPGEIHSSIGNNTMLIHKDPLRDYFFGDLVGPLIFFLGLDMQQQSQFEIYMGVVNTPDIKVLLINTTRFNNPAGGELKLRASQTLIEQNRAKHPLSLIAWQKESTLRKSQIYATFLDSSQTILPEIAVTNDLQARYYDPAVYGNYVVFTKEDNTGKAAVYLSECNVA